MTAFLPATASVGEWPDQVSLPHPVTSQRWWQAAENLGLALLLVAGTSLITPLCIASAALKCLSLTLEFKLN